MSVVGVDLAPNIVTVQSPNAGDDAPTPMKTKTAKPKKNPNQYPPGWNAEKAQKLIAHYENQIEDEAVAEDEAAFAHEHDRSPGIDAERGTVASRLPVARSL